MEPIKIVRKGRERLNRGVLEKFDDLPIQVQEDFINIKKFLMNFYSKELEAYVYGSYKHGNWDYLSDYDVIIYERYNSVGLDELILEKTGLKANIHCTQNKIGVILIP